MYIYNATTIIPIADIPTCNISDSATKSVIYWKITDESIPHTPDNCVYPQWDSIDCTTQYHITHILCTYNIQRAA